MALECIDWHVTCVCTFAMQCNPVVVLGILDGLGLSAPPKTVHHGCTALPTCMHMQHVGLCWVDVCVCVCFGPVQAVRQTHEEVVALWSVVHVMLCWSVLDSFCSCLPPDPAVLPGRRLKKSGRPPRWMCCTTSAPFRTCLLTHASSSRRHCRWVVGVVRLVGQGLGWAACFDVMCRDGV